MGTLSVRLFGGVSGWRKHLLIVVILLSTVFVASMPGGVLWKIHDMRAGYFPNGIRLWQDLVWGAREGMQVGWLIPLSSFPYNLLVFVAGYAIAWAGFQLGHPRRKIKI
ncbi:MAG: hypothetical protein JNM63_09390 [Spirochaetia bacterium]|nr:hypothetical protein [Spirochaetia bacterium]